MRNIFASATANNRLRPKSEYQDVVYKLEVAPGQSFGSSSLHGFIYPFE